MSEYIGIRGHRGSGKKSFAALLGNTIDLIIKNPDEPNLKQYFEEQYVVWVDLIMKDQTYIPSELINQLDYVYLDAFGDVPKTFVNMLLGLHEDEVDNNFKKDHIAVNMRTFETCPIDDVSDQMLLSSEDAYDYMSKQIGIHPIKNDWYMSLRDFIMYFGREVMQRYFGMNVWIKSLTANEAQYNSIFDGDNSYRIYGDLKTISEVTYIKDMKGGVIVKLNRPGNRKIGPAIDDLKGDMRYDYEVKVNGDLMSIREDVWNIANKIIENNNHGKNKEN